MRLRSRDAGKRPGFEGDGAPKSANLWLRIRCRIRRAPLGAPHALKQRSGSACYLRTFIRHRASLSGFAGGRSNAPPSSASSWRGLLVVPGGAPMPPECSCCVHEPAGAAPRPASRTPHDAPFKWTRSVQDKVGFAPGDKRRKICPLPSGAALRQIAVDEVACRFDAFCKPGYTMVCRVFDCWCARCRYLYR
jgi:hypothetical protein